jgi:DNA-binding response OmpR family regulator
LPFAQGCEQIDGMDATGVIAVCEDDADIRDLLADYLGREGYHVLVAEDGLALDRLFAGTRIDLLILDWMLPGEDGLSICRRLRAAGGPPIIMLTARSEDIDRVLGLEMGADDYVAKPFNPRVLLAHVRALLRRTSAPPAPADDERRTVRILDLLVDLDARGVVRDGSAAELPLTAAEFDLLECFVTRPQRVLSRDQLLDWTRGRTADAFDRTIDVQVSRLRRKLEEASSAVAPAIKTVRNAGYILAAAAGPT